MRAKINRLLWRLVFVALPLVLWLNVALAQDGAEATEEASNFGPIWAILLLGLVAVVTLGFLMNRGGSSNDSNNK